MRFAAAEHPALNSLLIYSSKQPAEIACIFQYDTREPLRWSLSRKLLAVRFSNTDPEYAVQEGNTRLRLATETTDWMAIDLHTSGGEKVIYAPQQPVLGFLLETYNIVTVEQMRRVVDNKSLRELIRES